MDDIDGAGCLPLIQRGGTGFVVVVEVVVVMFVGLGLLRSWSTS